MKLHVEHNVTPDHFLEILSLFLNDNTLSKEEIKNKLAESKHKINNNYLNKNLRVLIILKVLTKEDNYSITTLGKKILFAMQYNNNLFFDIFHYLYYTAWDFENTQDTGFSWTYKAICDYYWENYSIDNEKKIANEVYNKAILTFNEDKLSVSQYAIGGVKHWLIRLNPPVLFQEKKLSFIRKRTTCSPELFILSINYYYKVNNISYNTPILINEDNKIIISKLCLIDVNNFGPMLELSKSIFPLIQIHNSVWGFSIILNKEVTIDNLIQGD